LQTQIGVNVARQVDDRANRADGCHRQLPIERLPLAYIEFDRDVRLVEWNPAAERIFGYAKREAVGRIGTDLIVPNPPGDHIDGVLNRLWAGDLNAHSVNENLTKDGRIIECDWFNTPVLDCDGTVTGAFSFVKEVTARPFPAPSAIEVSQVRDPDLALFEQLTPRQREVLRLVSKGHRTREIARELEVSVKTVEMHRAHVMDTLDIHDVPGLTRFAIRVALISAYD
jgi:PAS domain S-box-containing protein